MVLNDYYKNEYLVCGRTRDNYIIENCSTEFINFAFDLLAKEDNRIKSCMVKITEDDEKRIEKTLKLCLNDIQRSFIARDYVCCLIMCQALRGVKEEKDYLELLKQGLKSIIEGDFEKAREFHVKAPFPHEIASISREYGKIELNIFLIGTINLFIAQAVNNFLSAREPYSVKLFTTNKRLTTYLDQSNTRIECPHDYMSLNVENFFEEEIENF